MPDTVDLTKLTKKEDFIAKSSIASSLKVDLLTIAIGPEHHDLRLLDNKKNNHILGRISFNVSCFHIENISVDIKNVQCKVSHLVQNDISLKLKIREANSVFETYLTNPIAPQKLLKEETTIYNWIEPNANEILNNPHLKNTNLSLNKLLMSMVELRSSVIHIEIYDTVYVEGEDKPDDNNNKYLKHNIVDYAKKGNEINNNLNHEGIQLKPKFKFIGYAGLNFYKILSENDNLIYKQSSKFFQKFSHLYNNEGSVPGSLTNSYSNTPNLTNNVYLPTKQDVNPNPNEIIKFQVFDDITKPFSEDIYLDGSVVGKMEGTISIKSIPLIRQILCGVHTEKGFDISSIHLNVSPLSTTNVKKDGMSTEPSELKLLANKINSLLTIIVSNTSLTTLTQTSKEASNQILSTMTEIKQILEKSSKESCLYYNYENNKDLNTAQKIMLDLGLNILNILENLNNDQRSMCFEILILLCNRAEFDLGTLKLSLFDDKNIPNSDRLKVIENFLSFMNKSLLFVLERLSQSKNTDNESKSYVEFFLSVAYFRIPNFRKSFLDAICKNITDEFKFYNNNDDIDIDANPINTLIDWENLFYKRLESINEIEIKEKLKETEDIINKENWKVNMSKRNVQFFSMIDRLEKYIQKKIVISRNIKWKDIPGFEIIINVIIHELKVREIPTFPNQLVELLPIFINDSDIYNTIIRTIIMRTNVNDTYAVFMIVRIIDCMFSEYEKKKSISVFALKFDYNILKKAFSIIINIDHSLCVSKFLWLFYRNAHIMNIEFLYETWQNTFEPYFFYLFYHWSWQVRNVFYYFLLFIINYRFKNLVYGNKQVNVYSRRNSVDNVSDLTSHHESIKNTIVRNFSEKFSLVEIIRNLIKEKNLDPSFKNSFDFSKNSELSVIPTDVYKNIVISMHHYEATEKIYKDWEKETKLKKLIEPTYPDLPLQPPRDDVVEYSDSW